MGRLIILILIIITVFLLWRAFGPGSNSRINGGQSFPGRAPAPQAKGPEDDPEFLWEIKKERFKQQREAQRLAQENLRSAEQRALSAERRAAEAEQRAREVENDARNKRNAAEEIQTRSDNNSAGDSSESGTAS